MTFLAQFQPRRVGLHYSNNTWPSVPVMTLHMPMPIGDISLGDASNGLCGGMVFAVLDCINAGVEPPWEMRNPVPNSAAFSYVVDRLIASFGGLGAGGFAGALQYYEWMTLSDHETSLSDAGLWPHGLAWRTINDSLPRVRQSIDGGHPVALGLVRVKSTNPADLGKNHVVMAYGYQIAGTGVQIFVYDPNFPDRDDAILSFNAADPEQTTPITHSLDSEPIHGFFTLDYSSASPVPLFQDGHTLAAWESLGGTMQSAPAVATNHDGALAVLADLQTAFEQRVQASSGAGPWAPWSQVGSGMGPHFDVGAYADGRLLAASMSGPIHNVGVQLIVAEQSTPGGAWRTASLQPVHDSGLGITSKPSVVRWPDGRVEIFWRGTDKSLRHLWQASPTGPWAGTHDLGGILTGDPVAIVDSSGHVQVFAGGTDGAVWVIGWTSAGWGQWTSLGVPPGVGNPIGPLAVARNADGRLEVFLRRWSTNGHIVHLVQDSPGGTWTTTAWDELGLASTTDPVAFVDHGGLVNLLAGGPTSEPHHRRQVGGSRPWAAPWQRLGGAMQGPGAIGVNPDGRIELFVHGIDAAGSLFHVWEDQPGGPFHGF